jgi:hypothetical protein
VSLFQYATERRQGMSGDYVPYVQCAKCEAQGPDMDAMKHRDNCHAFAAGARIPVSALMKREFRYQPVRNPETNETRLALKQTLDERGARYGSFVTQAKIGAGIRYAMRASPNWKRLPPYMRLALDWISDKIARLLCGDPFYDDNWRDIAGYSTIVLREIEAKCR